MTRREILLQGPGIPRGISRNQGYPRFLRGTLRRNSEGSPGPGRTGVSGRRAAQTHTPPSPPGPGEERRSCPARSLHLPLPALRRPLPGLPGAARAPRAPAAPAPGGTRGPPRPQVESGAWQPGRPLLGPVPGRPVWPQGPPGAYLGCRRTCPRPAGWRPRRPWRRGARC